MAPDPCEDRSTGARRLDRRTIIRAAIAIACGGTAPDVAAAEPVTVGINPLFLDSDIELLARLERYLIGRLGRPVQLVKRRTYQEITALLVSGQLDAAWICDDPYVQHKDQLALLAVPLYRGEPLYRTYVIVPTAGAAKNFDDTRDTVHAFSDPDSTSGFLVTRYLLALRHTKPAAFFRDFFFTYGHRNVVRAVAAGLAGSGSVDGYVWEVMSTREPALTAKTRVVYRSEPLGFPPIVSLKTRAESVVANQLRAAFFEMAHDPDGRAILRILDLDGFTTADPQLYRGTRDKWLLVKAQA